MENALDLMPMLIDAYEFLKPTLTVIIMFLVALAIEKVRTHFKLKSEVLSNARLQEILGRGISFGLSRLEQSLQGKTLNVNVKNEVIRLGIDYATRSAPETLKKFGVTPERLKEMVEAKLGELQAKAPVDAPAPRETP